MRGEGFGPTADDFVRGTFDPRSSLLARAPVAIRAELRRELRDGPPGPVARRSGDGRPPCTARERIVTIDVQPVRDDAPNSPQERPSLGYVPFVLLVGVLYWGGATAALIILWESWQRGAWIPAGEIAAKCVIFPLGGILFGHLMWRQRERLLAKARANRTASPTA
jgi:hypothetical protein